MRYVIDDHIPAPPSSQRKGPRKSDLRLTLEALQPGQSFMVCEPDEYKRLRTAASLLVDGRYVTKKIPSQGWRVWRVA
jgi:hypothetical protein